MLYVSLINFLCKQYLWHHLYRLTPSNSSACGLSGVDPPTTQKRQNITSLDISDYGSFWTRARFLVWTEVRDDKGLSGWRETVTAVSYCIWARPAYSRWHYTIHIPNSNRCSIPQPSCRGGILTHKNKGTKSAENGTTACRLGDAL